MRFLTLALSYKFGGLCVAGLDYDNLCFVRLGRTAPTTRQCKPLNIQDLLINNQIIRIGDLIDVDVAQMPIDGCQTENYRLIKVNAFIKSLSIVDINTIYNKLNHTSDIFYGTSEFIAPQDISTVNRSIDFFKVEKLRIRNCPYNGKSKYKAWFTYNNFRYCNFSVTDCVTCAYPSIFGAIPKTGEYDNAYIAVTLPNDEWAKENGFYKYVSGIVYYK